MLTAVYGVHVHSPYSIAITQGRHVKTGQLAAIKIMEVTEVQAVVQRAQHVWWW